MNYGSTKAWPYVEARKVVQRNIVDRPVVFETGFGPTNKPHIGTFAEVARTSMVRRAYEDIMGYTRDQNTRLIVFSDDMDAMRSVPDNVPDRDRLGHYVGYSLTSVPDPYDKFESFAHHNNAMLRKFLDRFGFEYEFMSSTQTYASGTFDNALSKMWENYDTVLDIILPTLGEARRATYSPFMPILDSGLVISEGVQRVEITDMVGFPNPNPTPDAPDKVCNIRGARTKCQWKADWALRWLALGVDYEMAGKDLTDSVALSSKIVRALGGRPPASMIYELFLDEDGHKISKSRGNGLTIDEWLRYGSTESLLAYLFREPQRSKKMGPRLVPTAMDDYNEAQRRYGVQPADQRLSSPVHHIGPSKPLSVSYQLVLNIAATAAVEDFDTLLRFVLRGATDTPALRAMVNNAYHYYRDHLRGEMIRRAPTEDEIVAINVLLDQLRSLGNDPSEDDIQFLVYEVGKTHYSKERLRDWFRALYEITLGQESGPRFGAFAKMYGVDNTIDLLESCIEA